MSTIIAFATDHAGVELKEALKAALPAGYTALDLGTNGSDSVDYPDYAQKMIESVSSGKAAKGVLICGSGIGMSMAVNRHPSIRGALCHTGLAAELCRRHNDANVLVLGARLIGSEEAKECMARFLTTEFEGGRHHARIAKMSN